MKTRMSSEFLYQLFALLISVIVVLVTQLISDIGYVYLNPRIRIS